MWIFTTRGYLSLVVDKHEPTLMHVRARVREDILAHFPDAQVETWPGSDYLYRAILPRSEIAAMMWDEVMTTDVKSHFKDAAIARSPKPASGTRHTAMYSIWSAMALLQPIAPYQTVPRGSAIYPARPATSMNWGPAAYVNPPVWKDESLLYKPTQRATTGHFDWSTHPQSTSFQEPDISDPGVKEALRKIDQYEDAAAAAGADLPVDTTDETWELTDEEWDNLYNKEHDCTGLAAPRTPKMPRGKKARRAARRKGRKS